MTLLFGNLTLEFVNFGKALQQANQNDNASSAEAVRNAGNLFKKAAAKDATYLVCIGENLICPGIMFDDSSQVLARFLPLGSI
jgi:hypothetical protein